MRAAPLLAICLLTTTCASPAQAPLPRSAEPEPVESELHHRGLGEYYRTEIGNIKVIRVHDEFRVIRCIQDGPFHGCFVEILTVPRTDMVLSDWMEVEAVDGLQLAFVTPEQVVLRQEPADGER